MPLKTFDVWVTLPRGGFLVVPVAAGDADAACNVAALRVPMHNVTCDRVVDRKEGAR